MPVMGFRERGDAERERAGKRDRQPLQLAAFPRTTFTHRLRFATLRVNLA
jgi:hypothetical protein